MYKVQPFCGNVVIDNLPTSMYTVKNYHQSNDATNDISSNELDELIKHQEKQLRKLNRLQTKSNELCDELHLDNLIVKDSPFFSNSTSSVSAIEDLSKKQESQLKKLNLIGDKLNKFCEQFDLNLNLNEKSTVGAPTKTASKAQTVFKSNIKWDEKVFSSLKRASAKKNVENIVPEDLVIQVDPNYVPVLLFSQINQIAANHKCFVKFHVHGSVLSEEFEKDAKINARIQNVAELFSKLNLNLSESRLKYDFGFTFVWKKADKPENQIAIGTTCGEIHVMTHVNTLIKEATLKIDVDQLKKNSSQDPLIKMLKQF